MVSDNYIIVGKFGRSYGIKGHIIVHSFTDPVSNILTYSPIFFKDKTEWLKLNVLDFKNNGKHFLMSLADYASPETVSVMTNKEIAISRQQLTNTQKNEFYCHDLINLLVTDINGFVYGNVVDVMPTGSNDVLIVQSNSHKKRYLIPFLLNNVIKEIDLNKKSILVEWDPNF